MLFIGLYRQDVYRPLAGWGALGLRMLCANTAMVLVIVLLGSQTDSWLGWTVWQRVWQLGILCIAGGLSYCCVLFVLGLRMRHLRH